MPYVKTEEDELGVIISGKGGLQEVRVKNRFIT